MMRSKGSAWASCNASLLSEAKRKDHSSGSKRLDSSRLTSGLESTMSARWWGASVDKETSALELLVPRHGQRPVRIVRRRLRVHKLSQGIGAVRWGARAGTARQRSLSLEQGLKSAN